MIMALYKRFLFIYFCAYLLLTKEHRVRQLTEEGRESLADSRRIGRATALARSRNKGGWLNRCRQELSRQ